MEYKPAKQIWRERCDEGRQFCIPRHEISKHSYRHAARHYQLFVVAWECRTDSTVINEKSSITCRVRMYSKIVVMRSCVTCTCMMIWVSKHIQSSGAIYPLFIITSAFFHLVSRIPPIHFYINKKEQNNIIKNIILMPACLNNQ